MLRRACFCAGLIVTGLMMLALASSAIAQETPDASCPGPPDSDVFSSNGGKRVAQTFTALHSGALTTAQMSITKSGTPGDWVIQIDSVDGSGTPTNTVLASTSVPDSSVTMTGVPVTITGSFAAPATVVAGQHFAIMVSRPGSDFISVGRRMGNVCPGGAFAADPSPAAFSSLVADIDLVFATFVVTPAADTSPPQTALGKHPKNKTRKSTAKFTFSSDEPGSTFQCKLDKKPFKPCASPMKYKHLKPKKHVFKVRSIDASGNLDATPVTFKWRVLP
jgi:hypothetical protein